VAGAISARGRCSSLEAVVKWPNEVEVDKRRAHLNVGELLDSSSSTQTIQAAEVEVFCCLQSDIEDNDHEEDGDIRTLSGSRERGPIIQRGDS